MSFTDSFTVLILTTNDHSELSVGKKRGTALSYRKEQVMLYIYNVIIINGFIYIPPHEICEQITSTPYPHWSLGTDIQSHHWLMSTKSMHVNVISS